jgi:hypothetical protein
MLSRKMKLNLINGFSGSGKTTAIINATKILVQQGKRVGNIPNNKCQFQVDTALSITTADFLRRTLLPDWEALILDVNTNSLSVMLNVRLVIEASDFHAMAKNAVILVAHTPGIKIQCEEGTLYNPEMSMNQP